MTAMKRARKILPAATTSSGPQPSVDEATPKVRKRSAVQRACNACRRIKCKCDGVRPTCGKCFERKSECIYDTKEGMSRTASLRDSNESLMANVERYKEIFEGLLKDNPSQETQDRLRSIGLSLSSAENSQSTSEQSPVDLLAIQNHDQTETSIEQSLYSLGEASSSTVNMNLSPPLRQVPPPLLNTSLGGLLRYGPDRPTSRSSGFAPLSHGHALSFSHSFDYDPQQYVQARAECDPYANEDVESFGYSPRLQKGKSSEQAAHPGPGQLAGGKVDTDWVSGGYDPNDGRISGKQEGWHPALVVRDSQEIASSRNSTEARGDEYRRPYSRATPSRYPVRKQFQTHDLSPSELLNPQMQSAFSRDFMAATPYQGSNIVGALETSFDPPPGAVMGYGILDIIAIAAKPLLTAGLGNLPMSSAILVNGYPPSIQRRQLLNFRVPDYTIPPLLVTENSDLSRLYVGFKENALALMSNGFSTSEIIGDSEVIYVDLFIRDRVDSDAHTVCNWASELIKSLPGFDRYVQLAWIALVARFMRWIIIPSRDNYARIPAMMKPLQGQRLIPHSPALDLCPHPGMREALMQHYRDWLTPSQVGNSEEMVWSGDWEDAVTTCEKTGRLRLTTEFELYTQHQENWTLNSGIRQAFPEATEFNIRVREDGMEREGRSNTSTGKMREGSQGLSVRGGGRRGGGGGGGHGGANPNQDEMAKNINKLETSSRDQNQQSMAKHHPKQ